MGAVIEPLADASPQRARIIGVVYLLYFLFALSPAFVQPRFNQRPGQPR
jgi:hypothetical protein